MPDEMKSFVYLSPLEVSLLDARRPAVMGETVSSGLAELLFKERFLGLCKRQQVYLGRACCTLLSSNLYSQFGR